MPLEVGNKIELFGGYDMEPAYLKAPPDNKRTGVVLNFIQGQNGNPAAVIQLDQKISGQKISGNIAILETRYAGQTWGKSDPVHIELCDFIPEDKAWKDRKQGEWIEAAASYKIIT